MSTPEEMAQKMLENLEQQYGQTKSDWMDIIRDSGLEKHGLIVSHLKKEIGMSHGYANLLAKLYGNEGRIDTDDKQLITRQYSGKESLKPIYDAIIEKVNEFGSDVEIAPKKSYVSLRRNKQFAIIQPSTKKRLDVGINFQDKTASGRLELAGSFNGMVSHRVRIESLGEIDQEFIKWLNQAYKYA